MANNTVDFSPAVLNLDLGVYYWRALAYDGTKFVALGYIGHISTSTDGENWTAAVQNDNLGSRYWRALAYDGTKFVALGISGHISTSTDGENWTAAVQNANLGSKNWVALAYDGTKFVALDISGHISTSTDGENWTAAVQNANLGSKNWNALAYDGTKFVALGISGHISTSTDGENWTAAVQNANLGSKDWRGALAYDGTKFVALDFRGHISTSTDGENWTAAVQNANLGSKNWNALAYDGTKFVALSYIGYISMADNSEPEPEPEPEPEYKKHTDKQYRDAALAMLPKGPAWNHESDSVIYQFMWAIGACMAVLESDLSRIALETRIKYSDLFLGEWETDYNLTPDYSLSIEERRTRLLQKSQKKQFPDTAGLIQLAADIGYEIQIVHHLPFTCGDPKSQCGLDEREIGVTRSMIGISVLSSTGDVSLEDFTSYMESFLPAHVQLGVAMAS